MAEYIANTSPLVYLHRLGAIDLLPSLFGRIIVPRQVEAELRLGREKGYDLPDPLELTWVDVRTWVPIAPQVERFAFLGPGESAVLTTAARTPNSVAIIDELPARKVAHSLGLQVTGTLNVLVAAKKRNHIPAVGPLVARLDELGFRMSPTLIDHVLAMAGER
jgi:predicted nucleic acid-binding protein